ncbi:MAG: aspartate/glutamate racemase family protein, partial [Leptolyngbya sp. SIO1D8]|nr:aspartate/glutamate racemase family protein [Leptolyngbya sp. SIO1D8]
STELYYRHINEGIKAQLGGLHSAKIALVSVDFHDIETLQHQGNWAAAGQQLAKAAQSVEAAGADFLLICTNTMHKVVPQIESVLQIPILHIADATALAIKAKGLKTVGLLGTQFTMEQAFYKDRLIHQHGLQVLVPSEGDREIVHRVIYEELCLGVINPNSHREYLRIMAALKAQGAEGIIAGCTEITLLVKQADLEIPLLDTTALHAAAAVTKALDTGSPSL